MKNQIYSPAVLANYSVIMPKNEEHVLKGDFFRQYENYLELLRTTEPKDKRAVMNAIRETVFQLEMFNELAVRAKLNNYVEEKKISDAEAVIRKEIDYLENVYRSLRKHLEKSRFI